MEHSKLEQSPLTKIEKQAVETLCTRPTKEYSGRLHGINLCGHDDPTFETSRDVQVLVLTQREDGEIEDLAMDMVLDILLDTGIYLTVKTFSKARFDTFRKAKIPMIQSLETGRVQLWKAA